jgi:hypothetical protein
MKRNKRYCCLREQTKKEGGFETCSYACFNPYIQNIHEEKGRKRKIGSAALMSQHREEIKIWKRGVIG